MAKVRIAIFGVGAVGTWIGAHLASAGLDVTAFARGERLKVLHTQGWRCEEQGRVLHSPARALDSRQAAGTYDVVVIAVKTQALADCVGEIAALCTGDTVIVPALNGVPWWLTSELPLGAVHQAIREQLPLPQVLGCVLYVSAQLGRDGVARVSSPGRVLLGEPTGPLTRRLHSLASLFQRAELPVQESTNIRGEVWDKLTANLVFNPLSALTRSWTGAIAESALLRPFIKGLVEESRHVAEAMKLQTNATLENILEVGKSLGSVKTSRTSMLQDVENGRRLELDSIVHTPRQIAKCFGIDTPHLNQLHGLMELLDSSLSENRSREAVVPGR